MLQIGKLVQYKKNSAFNLFFSAAFKLFKSYKKSREKPSYQNLRKKGSITEKLTIHEKKEATKRSLNLSKTN